MGLLPQPANRDIAIIPVKAIRMALVFIVFFIVHYTFLRICLSKERIPLTINWLLPPGQTVLESTRVKSKILGSLKS